MLAQTAQQSHRGCGASSFIHPSQAFFQAHRFTVADLNRFCSVDFFFFSFFFSVYKSRYKIPTSCTACQKRRLVLVLECVYMADIWCPSSQSKQKPWNLHPWRKSWSKIHRISLGFVSLAHAYVPRAIWVLPACLRKAATAGRVWLGRVNSSSLEEWRMEEHGQLTVTLIFLSLVATDTGHLCN